MKHNPVIKHIALSGVLTALGIVLGLFAKFPLFGSNVYLVGIVVFLAPLILPFSFSFFTGTIIVILTDIFSGWGAYCWISFIAYGLGIMIVWLFSKMKLKTFFLLGLIMASAATTLIYFILSFVIWDLSRAISDLAATSIQFLIVVPVISMLFWPIKLIKNI